MFFKLFLTECPNLYLNDTMNTLKLVGKLRINKIQCLFVIGHLHRYYAF